MSVQNEKRLGSLIWGGLALFAMLMVIFLTIAPRTQAQSAPGTGRAIMVSGADIAGDGSAHVLGTGVARWVQVNCAAANSAAVRLGDSNTSATRGAPMPAGGGMMLPPIPSAPTYQAPDQYYDLSKIYYYAANGDKISLVWGM